MKYNLYDMVRKGVNSEFMVNIYVVLIEIAFIIIAIIIHYYWY